MSRRKPDTTAPRRRWPWTVAAVLLATAAAAGIRRRARRTGSSPDEPAPAGTTAGDANRR
jgi:hypothetical protein